MLLPLHPPAPSTGLAHNLSGTCEPAQRLPVEHMSSYRHTWLKPLHVLLLIGRCKHESISDLHSSSTALCRCLLGCVTWLVVISFSQWSPRLVPKEDHP